MPEKGEQEDVQSSQWSVESSKKRSAETADLSGYAVAGPVSEGAGVPDGQAAAALASTQEGKVGRDASEWPIAGEGRSTDWAGVDSWQQAEDPATGALYYFNARLQDSRWDPPPEGYTPLQRLQHTGQLDSMQVQGGGVHGYTAEVARQGWCYVDLYGCQQGPFSKEQLKAWWDARLLNAHTRLWRSEDPSRSWQIALGELINQWEESEGRSGGALPGSASSPECNGFSEYAAAALAGLPENDDAVKIAKLAAATGQNMNDVLRFSYGAASNRAEEAPTVRAVHNPRTGRIEREPAEGAESTYAGMESWLDSRKLEEQMQAMKARKEQKLPAEVWKKLRARKQETKLKVKRKDMAWLYQ